jgi:lipopolysaccharide transport system ATP-binding protein
MLDDDVAIRIQNLSKCYTLYDRPEDRLKQSIVPRLQRLAGHPPTNYYREFWALREVSFEVRKGETLGIIGRNGSGKSTLLQIICGTLHPTSGAVTSQGRIAALLELGSGFNPEFTGRENVYMNGAILGLSKPEIDARFDSIAAFADIGEFMDQPLKCYSSGMSLRLAFAVIAHVDADILVIDEALAVGDAFFVQKCMRFLRRFMERGTVLFVSHDTAAVINLCERAVWLQEGRIEGIGAPKDICEGYLARIYESQQGPHAATGSRPNSVPAAQLPAPRDMRLDFINRTRHRNDIELFAFDANGTGFGKGNAVITSAVLTDERGAPLSWTIGGEDVTLVVTLKAFQALAGPIVGFYIKDRLGQPLFGDNTYLTYQEAPPSASAGQTLQARFSFRMPILPAGDYSICVAVAEGTQSEHVQHHWMHDALVIKSHSSSVCTGLIGIPMTGIELAICDHDADEIIARRSARSDSIVNR